MNDLQSLLIKIDSLKSDLERLKPLKVDDQMKLDEKFRLEWSYNSNHIEGNTLSYFEAKLAILKEITSGNDHTLREYQEMVEHDVAVKQITALAMDKSRHLTESDIRELNKIILVKPYYGNAQTSDRQPTRKLIQPGVYKTEPNSVRLQNGEIFYYSSPEETPAKMQALIHWLRNSLAENKLHPVKLAAQFHYDFVCIHPFDDSNGRTSRLLMNYVLLYYNFPPVIIKSVDKRNYLLALGKADGGDLDSFIEYIAEELIWSLEINIKAAKGGSITEKDDLYKEIEIWNKGLSKTKIEHMKSVKVAKDLFNNSLRNLIEEYLISQKKNFDNSFMSNNATLEIDGDNRATGYVKLQDVEGILEEYEKNPQTFPVDRVNKWQIIYHRSTLKDPSKENVFVSSVLRINFKPLKYEIFHNETLLTAKSYPEIIGKDEIQDLIWICISETFEEIKSKSKPKS